MKFLVDVQGLHEEPYELPKHAYNHTQKRAFHGEGYRVVVITDLLYNYQGFGPSDHIGTCQRLIGRELEFEGFLEVEILGLREAILSGHIHNNWQPMVDMLTPESTRLKRNKHHDPAKQ